MRKCILRSTSGMGQWLNPPNPKAAKWHGKIGFGEQGEESHGRSTKKRNRQSKASYGWAGNALRQRCAKLSMYRCNSNESQGSRAASPANQSKLMNPWPTRCFSTSDVPMASPIGFYGRWNDRRQCVCAALTAMHETCIRRTSWRPAKRHINPTAERR